MGIQGSGFRVQGFQERKRKVRDDCGDEARVSTVLCSTVGGGGRKQIQETTPTHFTSEDHMEPLHQSSGFSWSGFRFSVFGFRVSGFGVRGSGFEVALNVAF